MGTTASGSAEQSDRIREVREKIRGYLTKAEVKLISDSDAITFAYQKAIVMLHFLEIGKRTAVRILSPVAADVADLAPDIMLRMLEKNSVVLFGKFSYWPNKHTIFIEYDLPGDNLVFEDFMWTAAEVASLANDCTEPLIEATGGKTFLEATFQK